VDLPPPVITLIAAMSEDGLISLGRGVPWDLPGDREHFRSYTRGKWLLVGRSTYEEMSGWFDDHVPLVLTRNPACQPPVGRAVSSVADAVQMARAAGRRELVVIGGGQVYVETMPLAHRLVMTHVGIKIGRGIRFPNIDPLRWLGRTMAVSEITEDSRHPYRIVNWERRDMASPF
jgi:dihydrofolate reductase